LATSCSSFQAGVLSDEVVIRAGASGLEARGRQRQMLLDEIHRRGSISSQEGADLLGETFPWFASSSTTS
jgi:hypothetical protein